MKRLRWDVRGAVSDADPYPLWARLREEGPVHRAVLPGGENVWLVVRHADATAALQDARFRKSAGEDAAPTRSFGPDLVESDPPRHTRLRALVSRAFSPKSVEAMRPRIERLAGELLDAARARGGMDVTEDYALPLSLTTISGYLGVPIEDPAGFRVLSNEISLGRGSAEEKAALARRFRAVFAARRERPEDDLVSALLRPGEGGDRLSEDELLGMVFLLLLAGHVTAVNVIANAVLALARFPEQRERLRKDPALIGAGFEELLRFDGPLKMTSVHFAAEDVEVSGTVVPRGKRLRVVLGSANRDAAAFADPDALDLGRDARRHLAFGLGTHYCLGAPLGRLEGRLALGALFERFPALRLEVPPEAVAWQEHPILRGPKRLPIRF